MTTVTSVEPVPVAAPGSGEDSERYEIINGQRVALPPMGAYAGRIAFELARKLGDFAEVQNLGVATVEVLFHLRLPEDRNRRPDAAFVSYQRWPRGRPIPEQDNAWDVVPDLAVEVVSPTDRAEEVMDKVVEYFQAGIRLVWVVFPHPRFVLVYESLTQVRGLTRTDELDGGVVLPEFRLPLSALFLENGTST